MSEELRALPGVDRLIAALAGAAPDPVISAAARSVIDDARRTILAGGSAPSFDALVAQTKASIESGPGRGLARTINATGVLIHTNLGRAPLGEEQLAAVSAVGGGYSNLELDLTTGQRGGRYEHSRRALTALSGAESALVVNNNAAAVLLALTALCSGREVVISRGELVEIGGEFRIPDVLEASGARLVEVGTTNRTRLADYERAITPDTATILKVHPSNYRIVGFTSEVTGRDIARVARARGVTFIHDVGSGLVQAPRDAEWATGEPSVQVAIEDGADLVTFSGDKLFGGPQAGIIVGRSGLIEKLEHHPLMRALRVDKVTLAVLEATTNAYLRQAWTELPLWRMATAPEDGLQGRAEHIARAIARHYEPDAKVEAARMMSVAGGGSVPGSQIPSWGITIAGRDILEVQRRLRLGDPPIIARIADDRLALDLRTVDERDDDVLVGRLLASRAT